MGEDLTDAEYEEMLRNRAKLRAALEGPRGAEVRQAVKDFFEFPPKSGEAK